MFASLVILIIILLELGQVIQNLIQNHIFILFPNLRVFAQTPIITTTKAVTITQARVFMLTPLRPKKACFIVEKVIAVVTVTVEKLVIQEAVRGPFDELAVSSVLPSALSEVAVSHAVAVTVVEAEALVAVVVAVALAVVVSEVVFFVQGEDSAVRFEDRKEKQEGACFDHMRIIKFVSLAFEYFGSSLLVSASTAFGTFK